MRRGLVAVSFAVSFIWALPTAALAEQAPALQLEIHWGEIHRPAVVEPADLADDGDELPASLRVPGAAARATDVTQVLRYQPLELRGGERAYDPSIRMNDTVTNALVFTGGAAIITSVIVE